MPSLAVDTGLRNRQRAFELIPEAILVSPKVHIAAGEVLKPPLLDAIALLDVDAFEFLFQNQLFVGSVLQVRFRCWKVSVTTCTCPNVSGRDLDMRAEPICRGVPEH